MSPAQLSPTQSYPTNHDTNIHTNGISNGHSTNGLSNGHVTTNGTTTITSQHNPPVYDKIHFDDNEEESSESEIDQIFPEDLNLRIMGIGVQYPPNLVGPEDVETIAKKWYPESTSMKKVLSINRYTGIDFRASIGNCTHPIANQPSPPSISTLHELFITHAVPLATSSCSKAIKDSGYNPSQITHTVFTTCTDSANPGYDVFVLKNLGIKTTVEKVLLHGVGCSGGLASLRTACNIALGQKVLGKKARVLCCATEISTIFIRSELESIAKDDEVRIGVCLFSDCSSAVVVSNGVGEDWSSGSDSGSEEKVNGEKKSKKGIYEILGWKHDLIPETEHDLGFDVDPVGWKVILTPRVPSLTSSSTPSLYKSLISSIPSSTLSTISPSSTTLKPSDLDWALHPGGSLILTSLSKVMDITASNLRASYEVYSSYGNSSSATVFSVMDKLRSEGESGVGGEGEVYGEGVGVKGGRKGVVGCAFGPGVTVEMVLMRRVGGDEGVEVEVKEGVDGVGVEVGGVELD